jgi:hypothetical protein
MEIEFTATLKLDPGDEQDVMQFIKMMAQIRDFGFEVSAPRSTVRKSGVVKTVPPVANARVA